MVPSRRLFAVAVLVSLAGSTRAAAQLPSAKTKDVAPAAANATVKAAQAARAVMSCKAMVPGQSIQQPDGGMLETFQGWFDKAEVFAWPDGTVRVNCLYGIDKAMPANRPSNPVHYNLKGFKAEQCSAVGPNIMCKQ